MAETCQWCGLEVNDDDSHGIMETHADGAKVTCTIKAYVDFPTKSFLMESISEMEDEDG